VNRAIRQGLQGNSNGSVKIPPPSAATQVSGRQVGVEIAVGLNRRLQTPEHGRQEE